MQKEGQVECFTFKRFQLTPAQIKNFSSTTAGISNPFVGLILPLSVISPDTSGKIKVHLYLAAKWFEQIAGTPLRKTYQSLMHKQTGAIRPDQSELVGS